MPQRLDRHWDPKEAKREAREQAREAEKLAKLEARAQLDEARRRAPYESLLAPASDPPQTQDVTAVAIPPRLLRGLILSPGLPVSEAQVWTEAKRLHQQHLDAIAEAERPGCHLRYLPANILHPYASTKEYLSWLYKQLAPPLSYFKSLYRLAGPFSVSIIRKPEHDPQRLLTGGGLQLRTQYTLPITTPPIGYAPDHTCDARVHQAYYLRYASRNDPSGTEPQDRVFNALSYSPVLYSLWGTHPDRCWHAARAKARSEGRYFSPDRNHFPHKCDLTLLDSELETFLITWLYEPSLFWFCPGWSLLQEYVCPAVGEEWAPKDWPMRGHWHPPEVPEALSWFQEKAASLAAEHKRALDAAAHHKQALTDLLTAYAQRLDREQTSEQQHEGDTLDASQQERAIQLGRDLDGTQPVAVGQTELCSGTYILGVQGVGKSSLLEQIAYQQMGIAESVIVFDAHGDLLDKIIARMPKSELSRTYLLDLRDSREFPFALNVFACDDPEDEEQRDSTRNQVMHAFSKLWPETRKGQYFKKLLRHVIITLIEHPQLTLADVLRLLKDSTFRNRYVGTLANSETRAFWHYDYGSLSESKKLTETSPLLGRIDELLSEPVIKRIICQPQATINIRELIENGNILLVKLPGNEDAYAKAAGVVGTLLMAMIYAATFSFATTREQDRPGFSRIVDEFQNFATDEFARLFSQGRKFKANQLLAHQYRDQLAESAMAANKDAALSAYSTVVFQTTPDDGRELASLFVGLETRRRPVNLVIDLVPKLDQHPASAVKEFAARYVWKFEKGKELLVLEALTDLLYDCQKYGRVNSARKRHRIQSVAWLLRFEHHAKLATLNVREYFDDYMRGTIYDASAEQERYARFVHDLDQLLEALIKEPITQGKATVTTAETAMTLQSLPRRSAYVKGGSETLAMETLALPAGVSDEEFTRRYQRLLLQTRKRYCRTKAQVERDLRRHERGNDDQGGEAPTRSPVSPPPPRPTTPVRRSYPVDS